MKKRLLALLLTVCLATTCMLSGTVAKYTTNKSANDNATVGKWGVQLSIDGSLFGTTYYDKNSGNTPATPDEISVSVKSTSNGTIIVPGTKNDTGITISLTGVSEVETLLTLSAWGEDCFVNAGSYALITPAKDGMVTEENYLQFGFREQSYEDYRYAKEGDWELFQNSNSGAAFYVIDQVVLTEKYIPIVIKLTDKNGEVLKQGSLKDVFAYLTEFNNNNKTYNAGYDFSNHPLNGAKITWEWLYEGNDTIDTVLGNWNSIRSPFYKLKNGVYTNFGMPDIFCSEQFNIEITVEQVD